MVSRRSESEAWAVTGGGEDGEMGLRESTGKIICLKVLKGQNDEPLQISRGSFFHIKGAA